MKRAPNYSFKETVMTLPRIYIKRVGKISLALENCAEDIAKKLLATHIKN